MIQTTADPEGKLSPDWTLAKADVGLGNSQATDRMQWCDCFISWRQLQVCTQSFGTLRVQAYNVIDQRTSECKPTSFVQNKVGLSIYKWYTVRPWAPQTFGSWFRIQLVTRMLCSNFCVVPTIASRLRFLIATECDVGSPSWGLTIWPLCPFICSVQSRVCVGVGTCQNADP
jgi:hypothetical protein